MNAASAASSDRAPPGKLPLAVMAPFSVPSIPIAALGVVVFVYLPAYFSGHLGVPLAMIGLVWAAVRLLDLPVDVLLAIAMDRTRTRVGRYRPWLVGGAPILMAALYALFMAPYGFSALYLFAWLAAMYVGNSIVSLSQQAWGATLAKHYHERSRLFAVLNAVGILGVLAAMGLMIAGPSLGWTDAAAVRACGWFIIGAVPVTVAVAALRAPEHVEPDGAHEAPRFSDYWRVLSKPDMLRLFLSQVSVTLGPGWMSAIYLFFFRASRGFTTSQATILLGVYILAGIPGALLMSLIARRIGKHRALMVTTTLYSLGLTTVLVLPKGQMLPFAGMMFFEGAWAAGFSMTVQAMLADVGDEIRLTQGRQRMSLVYAVNTLAQKIAAAGAIGLTLPLLQALGFDPREGAVNTPAAIHNLDLAFLIGPIVFVMLGGACVIGWRLDAARHGEIRDALERRDAAAALAAGEPPS